MKDIKEGSICFFGRQKCVVVNICPANKEKVYIKTMNGKPFSGTDKTIKLVKIEKLSICIFY